MMIRSSLSIVSYIAAAARGGVGFPTRPPRRARSGVFKFFTSWGGEGGRGRSSAQPVFSRAGGHFSKSSAAGASLDADAVGARVVMQRALVCNVRAASQVSRNLGPVDALARECVAGRSGLTCVNPRTPPLAV